MVMTNAGFDGTVDEQQFARMMYIGAGDGVDVAGAWAVTQGSGRQVSVAAQSGWAFAAGVVSRETVALTTSVPTPTQGAWHLVVRRIDWTAGTTTSGVSIALVAGVTTSTTTAPSMPPATFPGGLNVNPGTLYDQPLAWVFVQSVNTTLTIFDARKLPLGPRVSALERQSGGVMVTKNIAQSTVNGTTILTLNNSAPDFDTFGMYNPATPTRLTFPFPGRWRLSHRVASTTPTATITLYNGSASVAGLPTGSSGAAGAGNPTTFASNPINVGAAGDYVETRVQATSVASITAPSTAMWADYLGAA